MNLSTPNFNSNLLGSDFFFFPFFLVDPPLPVLPVLLLRVKSTSRINSCTSSCVGHWPNVLTTFTTSFAEIAPVLPVAMSESANAWPIFISSSSENLFPCFRGDPASDFFLFLPFSPPGESDKSVVRQVLSTYFSIFHMRISKGHV